MKAKHVFTTLGIAFTMGIGVFAGIAMSRTQVRQAKAEMTSWYVVGSFDGANKWSHSTGYAMTETSTNVWVKENLEFKQGDEFKICDETDDHWQGGWSYNNGSSSNKSLFNAPEEGSNITCVTAGTYDVTFTKNDWHIQIEPSSGTKYNVEVYVDGVKRGTEQVNEGALPVTPTITDYGKGFSGWYTNPDCSGERVTAITSDTTVYGEIINLPQWSYKYDISRVSDVFKNDLYLYAFESGGRANHAWPGAAINGNSFVVPNDATIILVDVKDGASTAQTIDITQSFVANDTIRVLNDVVDGKYDAVFESTLDEPDEDGYYIVGVDGEWSYDYATKMTFNPDYSELDADHNVAVYFGLALENGDKIKVRSFIDEVDKWYGYNNTEANYECTADGLYDIFYKENTFYVAEHKERYTVSVYNVLFQGSTKASQAAGTNQLATEDVVFNPTHDDVEGYRFLRTYTNEALTTEYTPAAPTANFTIYQKYMKLGVYLCGFDDKWGVEDSTYAPATGGNLAVAEGVVVATDGQPLKFYDYTNDAWYGYSNLGADFSAFVSEGLDDNMLFKAGTYSLYLNSEGMIYIEAGLNSYMTTFLAKMAEVCDAEHGVNTNKVGLSANWSALATAYANLAEDDRLALKNAVADPESADNKKVVAAAYDYIYTKYHEELSLANFMNRTYAPGTNRITNSLQNNNMLLVVVISSIALVTAAGLFFVIRRKKHN